MLWNGFWGVFGVSAIVFLMERARVRERARIGGAEAVGREAGEV